MNMIEWMKELLINVGFKCGLDVEYLKSSLVEGDEDYCYSLKFVLDCLVLGVVVLEYVLFYEILSYV